MSIKVLFWYSHLEFYPAFLGDVSDEIDKRFLQDSATMEIHTIIGVNPGV